MRKNMRNYAKICESHNSPPPVGWITLCLGILLGS